MQALYEAKVRVPDALSVIVYNDNLAAYLAPPLTCIPQPFAQVAAAAFGLITARLSDGDRDAPSHIVFPTTFIVRQSTGRPQNRTGA